MMRSLLWGSAPIFTRWSLDHGSPLALLILRFSLALARYRGAWLPARGSRFRVAGVGTLLIGGYSICYFLTLDHVITPGLLATLLGIQPLLTLLLTERRLSAWRIAGLLLSLSGLRWCFASASLPDKGCHDVRAGAILGGNSCEPETKMTTHTLLCYGDSNTHGTEPVTTLGPLARYSFEARWTGVLAEALGSGWRVIEEGLPARTTVHDDPIEGVHLNGLRYLRPCLLSQLPLDAMTLMLGTNDLKARFAVTPDDIALSIQRLLLEIDAASAQFGVAPPKVLLISPAPIRELGPLAGIFAGGEHKSRQLASRYRKMAREAGIGFVDAGALIEVSEIDGVHFEPDQQRVLGEAIAAEVTRMVG